MKVALLTREFPPDVYGGAGVHVDFLVRELRKLITVDVQAMGEPREGATAHTLKEDRLAGANAALQVLSTDIAMTAAVPDADVVHSHTWYANMAGHWAKLLYDVPHVATVHSLEPLRPWKAEQLGGGYALSSWCERIALESANAVIAVSEGMKRDVLEAYPALDPARVQVIYNGIDAEQYAPDTGTDVLDRWGVDPGAPSVVFVGRITRQKGVPLLVEAALDIDPAAQIVLCAGAPDTPEIAEEVRVGVERLRAERGGVIWIEEMLPKSDVIQLLSHATLFACPSIYEPLGIVNLEAMACATAVVATATGGIVEVVVDGETGFLVPIEPGDDGTGAPRDPAKFAADFGWDRIADQVAALYRRLL